MVHACTIEKRGRVSTFPTEHLQPDWWCYFQYHRGLLIPIRGENCRARRRFNPCSHISCLYELRPRQSKPSYDMMILKKDFDRLPIMSSKSHVSFFNYIYNICLFSLCFSCRSVFFALHSVLVSCSCKVCHERRGKTIKAARLTNRGSIVRMQRPLYDTSKAKLRIWGSSRVG